MELCVGLKSHQKGFIKVEDYDPFDKNPDFLSKQFYLPERPEIISMKAIDFASEYGVFWNKKEEGIKQGKEEIARNMLKKGLDISLVSEISGLTIEEIQELTKTNQE